MKSRSTTHGGLLRRLLVVSVLALVFVVNTGGGCGPGFEDPCEDDRFGCEDDGTFAYLDSCDLTGDLSVDVGHGESEFTAFDAGDPTVYWGGQGGQHLFAAVRIGGFDLTVYDKLRLELAFSVERACDVGETAPCYYDDATREIILGSAEPIEVGADGLVELSGLLLRIGGLYGDSARLSATVEDPCMRTGTAAATWSP